MTDTLIYDGSAIKYLGNNKIGGHVVIYSTASDCDLVQEFFDVKTDFDFDDGDKRSIYFNHGMDNSVKNIKMGKSTLQRDGDIGIWMEGIINSSDKYSKAILKLIEEGRMGYSSGAVGHLVRKTPVTKMVSHIDTWPIGEVSITEKPAEPRTYAMTMKNWSDELKSFDLTDFEEDSKSAVKAAESITTVRLFEDFLRDAGFSSKQAKVIASKGYNSLRDAGEDELKQEEIPNVDPAILQAKQLEFKRLCNRLESLQLAAL